MSVYFVCFTKNEYFINLSLYSFTLIGEYLLKGKGLSNESKTGIDIRKRIECIRRKKISTKF